MESESGRAWGAGVVFYRAEEAVAVEEAFDEVAIGAEVAELGHDGIAGVGGADENGDVLEALVAAEVAEEGAAVGLGHHDVEDDELGDEFGGIEQFDGVLSALGAGDLVAFATQVAAHDVTTVGDVVNDQDHGVLYGCRWM